MNDKLRKRFEERHFYCRLWPPNFSPSNPLGNRLLNFWNSHRSAGHDPLEELVLLVNRLNLSMSACLRAGFGSRLPTFEVRVEHVSPFIWDSYLLPWLQVSGAKVQGDGFHLLTVLGHEQVRCTPLSQRELERRASDISNGLQPVSL
jgi:hypothetical protein